MKKTIKDFIFSHKEVFIICGIILILFNKVILNPYYVLTPSQDIWGQYYLWKWIIVSSVENSREIPLWNPYSFSGLSLIGNPLSGMFYPSILLFFLLPIKNAFGFIFLIDFLLIALFTYFYSLSIKLGKYSALITSLVFALSSTLVTKVYAGHLANIETIVWFPATLYFFEKALNTKKIKFIIFQSFSIGLMILAGHVQFAFYGLFTILLYQTLRIVNSRVRKRKALLLFVLIPAMLGLCISSVQLLPSIEMSQLNVRSGGVNYEFSSSFSFHPYHLITLFFPYALGTPQGGNYWGKGNFWELAAYIGILPLFFSILSIYILKKNYFVKVFLFLGIFSLLFAMGRYSFIFPIFYKMIPGFNLFRIPATFLFIYSFSAAVLCGFGVQFFISTKKKLLLIRNISLFTGILSIGILFLFIMQRNFILQNINNVLAKYFESGVPIQPIYSLLLRDIIQFTIFVFCVFFLFVLKNRLTSKTTYKLVFFTLIISNLLFFSLPFIKVLPYETAVKSPKFVEVLSKDNDYFRTYDFTGTTHPSVLAQHNLESITGSDPTLPKEYRNFLWRIGPYHKEQYEPFIYIYNISYFQPLRILNTKYIVSEKPIFNKNVTPIDIENSIYVLNNSLPKAYIVPEAIVEKDEEKRYELINNSSIDLAKTVILHDTPPVPLKHKGQFQKINIQKSSVNSYEVEIKKPTNGFLVISESWNKSWNAYSNGKKLPLYQANGIVKALYINNKISSVSLKYEPFSYSFGVIASAITLSALTIIFIFYRNKTVRL